MDLACSERLSETRLSFMKGAARLRLRSAGSQQTFKRNFFRLVDKDERP